MAKKNTSISENLADLKDDLSEVAANAEKLAMHEIHSFQNKAEEKFRKTLLAFLYNFLPIVFIPLLVISSVLLFLTTVSLATYKIAIEFQFSPITGLLIVHSALLFVCLLTGLTGYIKLRSKIKTQVSKDKISDKTQESYSKLVENNE
ncbi:MAG: hypothetical protein KDD56_10915, partial [Bdellovibrionales bacterium]|nr:hypothetical protein [Bdellovibrionales bacterium]